MKTNETPSPSVEAACSTDFDRIVNALNQRHEYGYRGGAEAPERFHKESCWVCELLKGSPAETSLREALARAVAATLSAHTSAVDSGRDCIADELSSVHGTLCGLATAVDGGLILSNSQLNEPSA